CRSRDASHSVSTKHRSARTEQSTARMAPPPVRPANEDPSTPPPPDAPGNPLPPDVPGSPPPETPRRGRPSAVTWLGVAVAGVGLVLGVLGLVSLFMSRDNGVTPPHPRLPGPPL